MVSYLRSADLLLTKLFQGSNQHIICILDLRRKKIEKNTERLRKNRIRWNCLDHSKQLLEGKIAQKLLCGRYSVLVQWPSFTKCARNVYNTQEIIRIAPHIIKPKSNIDAESKHEWKIEQSYSLISLKPGTMNNVLLRGAQNENSTDRRWSTPQWCCETVENGAFLCVLWSTSIVSPAWNMTQRSRWGSFTTAARDAFKCWSLVSTCWWPLRCQWPQGWRASPGASSLFISDRNR